MLNITLNEDEKILVNGILDKESEHHDDSDGIVSATFFDESAIKEIISFSFKEVSEFYTYFEFDMNFSWWDELIHVFIVCDHSTEITVDLVIEPNYWAKGWSIQDYSDTINLLLEKYPNLIHYGDEVDFGFRFKIGSSDQSPETIIENVLTLGLNSIRTLIDETNNVLLEIANNDTFITFFNFPEEIRTPCQQYLMYFVQFLKDIGIDAKSEIREYAQSTLFRIIPEDKNEALDKIRDALRFI